MIELVVTVVGVVAGAVSVLLLTTVLRFRWLCRRPGSVVASLRDNSSSRRARWRLGVLRMQAHRVEWHSARILTPRPLRRWQRSDFVLRARRPATSGAGDDVPFVVDCQAGDRHIEFLMSRRAYAGLASWYESAPPHVSAEVF